MSPDKQSGRGRFEVTPEHVKLLQAAYWRVSDVEYGAPCIDPKRPYGNSDVEGDIGEILGEERGTPNRYGERDYSPEQCERFAQLHGELIDALPVIIDFYARATQNIPHDSLPSGIGQCE